jgi:hypothetical protein
MSPKLTWKATKEEREARRERWLGAMAGGLTMQDIADEAGLSRERVRQVVGPGPRWWNLQREALRQVIERNPGLSAKELCRLARVSVIYPRMRELGWKKPPRKIPEHGTVARYTYGCREECCRKANRENHAKWVEAHRGKCPEGYHGTMTGYAAYSCRCALCKLANREYTKSQKKPQEAATHGVDSERG